FSALRDCSRMLKVCASSEEQGKQLVEAYEKEVHQIFRDTVITPLARQVETDLRLHIHSVVLQQEGLRGTNLKDLSSFLTMKPIRLFDNLIDIREQITYYLDS